MKIKQKDIAILFTGNILKQFKKKIVGAKTGKVSSISKSVNPELVFIVADRDVNRKELKKLSKMFKTICVISNQKYTLLNSISSSYIVNNTYAKIVYPVLKQTIECFSKPCLINFSLKEIIEFFKNNKEVTVSYQKHDIRTGYKHKQIPCYQMEHLKSKNILMLFKCGSNVELDDTNEIANILLKNVSNTTSVSWVCEINSKKKNRLEVVVIAARGVLHEKR